MTEYKRENDYKYDAFISYNHIDEEAAHTIQHKMEKYRIPHALMKTRGSDSRGLKVFLDETDLSAGNLLKNLYEALDESAKLIVICSSRNKSDAKEKYKWVEREVQYFIDNNRSDDILPLVLDGDWNNIPENLKGLQNELFISDAAILGKRIAFLKVLSGVLETDFDSLVKRENIRLRIKKMEWGALAAVCLSMALLCFYYYVPHTSYYSDYVMRFGKPEGIGELSAKQRSVKNSIYAITTIRSKHEIYLKHINSAGLTSTDTAWNHIDTAPVMIFDCFDNWQINATTYLDEYGKELYTYVYAPDLTYLDIIKSKNDAQWLTTSAGDNEDGFPVRTDISRYRLFFSDDGFLSKCMYATDRLDAINGEGVGGEEYAYTSSGKLEQITHLDTAGKPIVNKYGIASVCLMYDTAGNNNLMEYRGIDGDLVNNTSWYSTVKNVYNEYGNACQTEYYDANNVLCITADGYAYTITTYDSQGFITSYAYYGTDKEPVYGLPNVHQIQIERDQMGRDKSISYFNTDYELSLSTGKYAKRTNVYNSEGLVIEQFYYGTDGQPYLNDIGLHHAVYEYDRHGNMISTSCYDIEGNLVNTSLGYAVLKRTYNDRGMEETQSYFGIYNEPIIGNEGYHKREYKYDDRYNIHEINYTGILGNPTLCTSGYALRTLAYDNAGNILEDSYYDDYGEPTYNTSYFCKAVMTYDKRGNRLSKELFNTDNSPADKSSYYKEEIGYDDIGRILHKNYYMPDSTTFGSEYSYDAQGRIVSEIVYDNENTTWMQIEIEYDDAGNEKTRIYSNKANEVGRITCEYDLNRNVIKESYNNSKNELLSYTTTAYNKNGMPTVISYYDADGRLSGSANPDEKAAVVVTEYNEHNWKTELRYYDESGNLFRISDNDKELYARLTMDYDKNGNCIESVCYDEANQVYQVVREEYDEYNRIVNRIYLDGQNRQLSRTEMIYNDEERTATYVLYNGNDKLLANPESEVAKEVYFYDEYGYVIGQEFYGDDDQLVMPYGQLYPKYCVTRENGRTIRIEYYGTDGSLALNRDGYAIEKFSYDERGREVSRSFYDANENPVLLRWRFSRYEIEYDALGNIKECNYYDSVNRPVEQVDGYMEQTQVLNDNIPYRILIFNGNDGTTLMGTTEVRIFVPLTSFVDDATLENISEDANSMKAENNDEGLFDEELFDADSVGNNEENDSSEDFGETVFSEQEYISILEKYIRAIECFDGTKVMDCMDQSLPGVLANTLNSLLGMEISENKIYHFYASFYSRELEALKTYLNETYGEDIYVTYEIVSEVFSSDAVLLAMNKELKMLGIDRLDIQRKVSLEIIFTVKGSESQGIEDTSFLSRRFGLLKINGNWGIAVEGSFPTPSRDDLLKLLE